MLTRVLPFEKLSVFSRKFAQLQLPCLHPQSIRLLPCSPASGDLVNGTYFVKDFTLLRAIELEKGLSTVVWARAQTSRRKQGTRKRAKSVKLRIRRLLLRGRNTGYRVLS